MANDIVLTNLSQSVRPHNKKPRQDEKTLMAKIFRPTTKAKNKKHLSHAKQLPDFTARIEKYDHELKAIAKAKDGRITFITGAMKGEEVKVRPIQYTKNLIHADTIEVLTPSADRVEPPCEHFAKCGGCQLQYISPAMQLAEKQNALDDLIKKKLKLNALPWQPAITGHGEGYRRTARLAVWHETDGAISIGFREQHAKRIIDVNHCLILAPSLTKTVQAFRPVLDTLNVKRHITHLQLFSLVPQDVMVIRTLKAVTEADSSRLSVYAEANNVRVILQTDKTEFVDLASDDKSADFLLSYAIDNMQLQFQPKDFIQINDDVNQQMVAQAIAWLKVEQQDTILDLFSGVGNFTLPLAKRAKEVFAVEGVGDMVRRIKTNADLNKLTNIHAYQADLSEINDRKKPKWLKPIDKLLLDPARDGAMDVVKKIPLLKPNQILYVSCNPATMLRDLEILQSADYHLTKIGLINMFPHTHHVEAMALLEHKKA